MASKLPSPSRSNSSAAASSADLLASRTRLTARANASSEDPAAAWLALAPWHHSLNHRAPTCSHKCCVNKKCVKVAAAIALQTDRTPTCSQKCCFIKGCAKVAAATVLQIGHCTFCRVHCQVQIVHPSRNVHGHDACTPAYTSRIVHAVHSASRQAESPTEGLEPVCKGNGSIVSRGKHSCFTGSSRPLKLPCAVQHWHCMVQDVPWW